MLLHTTCLFTLVATAAAAVAAPNNASPSKAYIIKEKKWWNGIIPMKFDTNVFAENSVPSEGSLMDAITALERKTCLRFFPANATANPFVNITRLDDNHETCTYDGQKKALSMTKSCSTDEAEAALARLIGFEENGAPLSPLNHVMIFTINRAYNCLGINDFPDSRLPLDPVIAHPSPDPEHSSYTFTLDKTTVDYAKRIGKADSWLAIDQICDVHSDPNAMNTQNWNFTRFKAQDWEQGKGKQFEVTVNRCKKRASRFAGRYRGWFCTSADEKTCDPLCEIREITIRDNSGHEIEHPPKGITVFDEIPWVCHERLIPFPPDWGFNHP